MNLAPPLRVYRPATFLRFDTIEVHKAGMTVNVAVLKIPELQGRAASFELWELRDRLANLRACGYSRSCEESVLAKWPQNGMDRENGDE